MTEPATAPVPAKGLFARAIGVIVSPRETFEDIVRAPRVFTAMLLVAAITAVCVGSFFATEVGKAAFLEQATKNAGSPDAAQRVQVIVPYLGVMYGGGAFVWVPIFTGIVSGLLYVVFNALMGGTATFRQVMAVVASSQFVSVLTACFTFGLNYFRGTLTSATNLGVFVPMLEEKSFLAGFLGAIDILLFWWLTTLAIGLSVLYRRKTGGIMTGFVILYVSIALVIAYFKSR